MGINNDYNYWDAILTGLSPDKKGHWPSRIPSGNKEGLILKSPKHSTLLKSLVKDIQQGYMYWYKDPEERKMYTFNKIQDIFKRMNADKFKKVK